MGFILARRKLIYFIAIVSVLFLIILAQWINQHQITENSHYAGLINIAGRQRMLSQKISKQVYHQPQSYRDALLADAFEWEDKHSYLLEQANTQSRDNTKIQTLFENISPHLRAMVALVSQFHRGEISVSELQSQIGAHEQVFLLGMEGIVGLWQQEAEESLLFFSRLEIGMASLSILVLLGEYLFIFRPAFELLYRQKRSIQKKNNLLNERVEGLEYSNDQLVVLQEELKSSIEQLDHSNHRLQDQLGVSNLQNQQLENAQKIAGIGYWSWDLEEKIEWSKQTFRIFDIASEKEAGPRLDDIMAIVHPEDQHLIFENVEKAKAKGSVTYQYRIIDRSGQIRYIHALVQASYDNYGEAESIFGVVRNITEEVNQKRILQDFNKNLKKLLELSARTPNPKQIQDILAYTCQFLGMEMGLVNKRRDDSFQVEYSCSSSPYFVIKQASKTKMQDSICIMAFESKELYQFTSPYQLPRKFSCMEDWGIQTYIGVPLILEEEVMGTMGFFSREKRPQAFSSHEQEYIRLLARIISFVMEKQRYIRKLESMHQHQENMMHIMAHDIRGPLNRLYGISKLLPVTSADTKQELEQIIEQEYKAGRSMIDDMLSMFSLESEQEIRFSKVDMSVFLEKIAQKTRLKTDACNLTLKKDIAGGLSAFINTEMMERVLDNLLDNAIKFTQRGGNIYLGLHKEGGQLQIVVEDNGIGIPPEIQPFLFQKFDKKMRRYGLRGEKSNGLGMSIVKEIVEKHGGKLELQSEGEGAGTRFTITFMEELVDAK